MPLMMGKLGQRGKRYGWRREEWTQTCRCGGRARWRPWRGGHRPVRAWKTSELMHLVCLQLAVGCDHCTETHSKSESAARRIIWNASLFFSPLLCVRENKKTFTPAPLRFYVYHCSQALSASLCLTLLIANSFRTIHIRRFCKLCYKREPVKSDEKPDRERDCLLLLLPCRLPGSNNSCRQHYLL